MGSTISADHMRAAVLQADALNRLLERLWAERVDARAKLYEAMRGLRLVRLTLAEEAHETQKGGE